jgi:hypothetical protein
MSFQGTRQARTVFIGPFKILEKRSEVAYQLELSPQLSDMHDVFHVSKIMSLARCCFHGKREARGWRPARFW